MRYSGSRRTTSGIFFLVACAIFFFPVFLEPSHGICFVLFVELFLFYFIFDGKRSTSMSPNSRGRCHMQIFRNATFKYVICEFEQLSGR